MFYKLGKLGGRLVVSQQLKAMYPQGLKPYVEPQPIIYDPAFKIVKTPVQEMQETPRVGSVNYAPLSPQLKKNMVHFQEDNNVPVHFKGGRGDYALFAVTCLLIAAGMFEATRFIYSSAYPNKNEGN